MVTMPGLDTKVPEVDVPRQVLIRLGVFTLELMARLGIREPEVMARPRRAGERREERDHPEVARPRRAAAREEHRGVLLEGVQEDSETHREGQGPLMIPGVETVVRTGFWT
jgi:hypothetical protein